MAKKKWRAAPFLWQNWQSYGSRNESSSKKWDKSSYTTCTLCGHWIYNYKKHSDDCRVCGASLVKKAKGDDSDKAAAPSEIVELPGHLADDASVKAILSILARTPALEGAVETTTNAIRATPQPPAPQLSHSEEFRASMGALQSASAKCKKLEAKQAKLAKQVSVAEETLQQLRASLEEHTKTLDETSREHAKAMADHSRRFPHWREGAELAAAENVVCSEGASGPKEEEAENKVAKYTRLLEEAKSQEVAAKRHRTSKTSPEEQRAAEAAEQLEGAKAETKSHGMEVDQNAKG